MRAWMLALLCPAVAQAGFYVGVERDRVNPEAGEKPSLIFSVDARTRDVTLRIASEDGAVTKTWTYKSLEAGQSLNLTWDAPVGRRGYDVTVTYADQGESATEQTWFEVAVSPPLRVAVDPASVDLTRRSFLLQASHPPLRVELEAVDDAMKPLGKTSVPTPDARPGEPIPLVWEAAPGNLFRVRVTAHDEFGDWAAVDLIPWSMSVPHVDIEFPTGSHDIPPGELPKLEEAWARIDEAVRRVSAWVECQLFVGGYTDTVGDAASNQGLSERRALAIARYFRGKGAKLPISYQGFGERGLAVATDDSVDEPRNRRATYVVAAVGASPQGADVPAQAWKRLP